MYCPQCGQQQVSETTRFCPRCGFLLEGVSVVLASGGQLPMRYVHPGNRELSPRSKGVRQGALLMLSTILIVPIVAILSVTLDIIPHILVPVAAIFCFVGGLLRIFQSLLMEDANPPLSATQLATYSPPAPLESHVPLSPVPASLRGAPAWRPRPNTAEIAAPPPSVTENTTRLLNKDEQKDI